MYEKCYWTKTLHSSKFSLFFIKSLETLDSGKLFADSVDDMDLTVKGFRYYAGWADKISGKTISAGQWKLFKYINSIFTDIHLHTLSWSSFLLSTQGSYLFWSVTFASHHTYMHCISPLFSSSDQFHWVFLFIISLPVPFQGCFSHRSFWSLQCGSFTASSICRRLSPKFFISNFFGPPNVWDAP